MTAVPHAPEETPGGAHPHGPGGLLRTARESAGMSLRDVSAQLHLDERTLVALEGDDFNVLPAPTFVRGYLRGYARLLGVPVGPVMEAYDREGFKPPDLVADIAERPQTNSGDFPMRVMTYGVVVVLVALVAAWWHNQGFDEMREETTPIRAAEPEMDAPSEIASAQPGLDAPQPPEPTAVARADVAEPESTPSPEPVGTPSRAFEQAASPASSDASTSDPGAATPSPEPSVATATARADAAIARANDVIERTRGEIDVSAESVPRETAPAVTERAAPTPVAAGGPAPERAEVDRAAVPEAPGSGRLRLSFPIEAWVEVYDRNEKRLFFNLVQPGRELDLRGEAPLRVLLGRTQGVSVEWNGRDVDLAPFTERGVARFTLEP